MKLKIILVFLLGIGIFSKTFFSYPECEKVFSSSVYQEWLQQLGMTPSQNNLRKSHEALITTLRNRPDQIASKLFSGIDLRESYLEFYQNTSFKKGIKPLASHDGLVRGNLPTLYFTHPEGTKVFRFSKPFLEVNFWQKLKFCPLFLQFIRENPNHVYVNVMKRKGQEAPYTKALENLDQIKVFTLDKNSPFYFQKNEPEIIDYASFKKNYLIQLQDPEGHFFWPVQLPFSEILDQVHAQKFNHKEMLTKEERVIFIELSYLSFLNAIVDTLHPPSLNITCHQGMDRGPSLIVLWMHEQQLSDKILEQALLFSPPQLISNRFPHNHRIERFELAKRRIDETQ